MPARFGPISAQESLLAANERRANFRVVPDDFRGVLRAPTDVPPSARSRMLAREYFRSLDRLPHHLVGKQEAFAMWLPCRAHRQLPLVRVPGDEEPHVAPRAP